ncbi:spore coat protein CotJB [Youxingia wuxianensis]|uniref:Spore coat protein CotJB n=1 Tax=Youxingia wuxianensis TaxID=2763678 RepID=A0A926ICY9_9FIRM|nr:spore coat protein CotJB [Youxingia wuxianensis]MBC8585702.1 spore coat protein CotJB [Youxingia wuxianensis]
MCERRRLLKVIQNYDFTLYDLSLYLDSHPRCKNALAYYSKVKQARDCAVAEFENKFGPLTHSSAANLECWQWVKGPWPWELEA